MTQVSEKAPSACKIEQGIYCYSGQDGECFDKRCPQLRDGEPEKSNRSCPNFDWHCEEEGHQR